MTISMGSSSVLGGGDGFDIFGKIKITAKLALHVWVFRFSRNAATGTAQSSTKRVYKHFRIYF
jgi:hypothetical protein